MANATIPLAKGRNDAKRKYPGYLSVKLDGVPIRLDLMIKNCKVVAYSAQSRQGEPVPSVETIVQEFIQCMHEVGFSWKDGPLTFVFEVTHKTLRDFKDVSGVVRRQEPQEDLYLNMFDVHHHAVPDAEFGDRMQQMVNLMQHVQHPWFGAVPQYRCETPEYASAVEKGLLDRFPKCEGLIWRDADAKWAPNKRRWDYQKLLNEPTMDLRIVGFEEAVCGKTGAGKGMVGRLNAEYKGKTIGIGPGKLTHKERTSLFEDTVRNEATDVHAGVYYFPEPLIAKIKYKRDDSYEALRQPTFQYWRPEKTEPSYE